MLHEYENELGSELVFWSNGCCDLFNGAGGRESIDIDGLPVELQRARYELYEEGSYLVEFEGRYGVALQAIYDDEAASYADMTYPELVSVAHELAQRLSERYPQYEIVFGKDAARFTDGTVETDVYIFLPWDTDQAEFCKVEQDFASMYHKLLEKGGRTMRTAKIIHQSKATPDWPYNVQVRQNRVYSGEGCFCKTREDAIAWATDHADVIEEEEH